MTRVVLCSSDNAKRVFYISFLWKIFWEARKLFYVKLSITSIKMFSIHKLRYKTLFHSWMFIEVKSYFSLFEITVSGDFLKEEIFKNRNAELNCCFLTIKHKGLINICKDVANNNQYCISIKQKIDYLI